MSIHQTGVQRDAAPDRRAWDGLYDRRGPVEVAFLPKVTAGSWSHLVRGSEGQVAVASGALDGGSALPIAAVTQVHSAEVVVAVPDQRPRADALHTAAPDLALAVVTADCVPVLIAAGERLAAVHAGWRGLAAGVVTNAVNSLGTGDRERWCAWIGPAIGACCYEVSWQTACEVSRHGGGRNVVRLPPGGKRPHLDLRLAAQTQLEALGLREVRVWRLCTRCGQGDATRTSDAWASYRRAGSQGGRNLALIWRRVQAT